jgi:hypothetical protein
MSFISNLDIFWIVYFNLSRKLQVFSGEDTQTDGRGEGQTQGGYSGGE